ncbi:DUF924 family protein [Phormidesmis sp. 146-33]
MSDNTLNKIQKHSLEQAHRSQEVLQFWFPNEFTRDQASIVRQWAWWFRGGGDAEIIERFSSLMQQATQGELDDWAGEPRSQLALILILDQFSRSLYRGTAQAFAQDSKACKLAIDGIHLGHYTALETPWEKTFFLMPLGHSENLNHLEWAIELADELVKEAPPDHRSLLEFSAAQARRHREVLARFGRQPHRNQLLGRRSTPEELEYLARGQFAHNHPFPPHLIQLLS